MNSVGVSARNWVGGHLQALGVTTKDLHGILHKHLAGTQTESVNFKNLVGALPEGTIARLKGQFPGIAGEKTDAEFLYAVMCSRSGENTQVPTFAHGAVFSRQVPGKIASAFPRSATELSNVRDLVSATIGDLKLSGGKTIGESRVIGAAHSVEYMDLEEMAQKLDQKTMNSIKLQLPKPTPASCKTPGDHLFHFMCMRLGTDRAKSLSYHDGKVRVKRDRSSQTQKKLSQSAQVRSPHMDGPGKSSSVAPAEIRQLTKSSPVAPPSASSVSGASSAAVQSENRSKLIAATRLDLTEEMSDGTFIFEDQNKNKLFVKDVNFLCECKNLNTLNILVGDCLTEIDLSLCSKLQHLKLYNCTKLTKVTLPPGRGAMDAHGSISVGQCPAFPQDMDLRKLKTASSDESGPIIFENGQKSTIRAAKSSAASPVQMSEDDKKLLDATKLIFKGKKDGKYEFDIGSEAIAIEDLSLLSQCKNLQTLTIDEPCSDLENLDLGACKNLQRFECRWCDNLAEVRFSPSATLQCVQFQGCTSLKKVTLPVNRCLQNFDGDGCPVFAGIVANLHIQAVANAIEADESLGNPQDAGRKKKKIFQRVTAQIERNDDGTTTFTAPAPKKRSLFARLFRGK
ncbi:MAG: hypothetical protein LBI34_02710 [Puniceicoccales bacterium]|jgi:hypothetical protein|nr:hypothetical protein [Puniceicoccales bacterium]